MTGKRTALLIDTTLRDGEQAAAVAFSRKDRIRIAKMLVSCGIKEIEAGIPAMGSDAELDFRAVCKALPSEIRPIAWNRLKKSDVEASLRAGATRLHITVPASDAMLERKLGWSREKALEELSKLLAFIQKEGAETLVGAEDASRAEIEFLEQLFICAEAGGASRLRYADTIGKDDPFAVHKAIKHFSSLVSTPMEYHAHNDLGMASANALAAIKAGAAVSVTVNGLGERAGNAALEQVAVASELILGCWTGLAMDEFPALCEMVAQASNHPISSDKPLTGAMVFSHESGIHIDGLIKDPSMYEFVRPQLLGRHHNMVPGRYSGRKAVQYLARMMGRDLEDAQVHVLQDKITRLWSRGAPKDSWSAFNGLLQEI
jgi:homocitrate synthase NifV